jgi:hypothetical protein
MRGLAASSAALLKSYEEALAEGGDALRRAIAKAFPGEGKAAEAASARLASYLKRVIPHLAAEPLAALRAGELRFPGISDSSGELLGD